MFPYPEAVGGLTTIVLFLVVLGGRCSLDGDEGIALIVADVDLSRVGVDGGFAAVVKVYGIRKREVR